MTRSVPKNDPSLACHMPMRICYRACLLLLAGWYLPARGVEPWADARLSVVEGLDAWYDAATLPAAEAQASLNTWPDGSGRTHVARSTAGAFSPQRYTEFVGNERVPVVRFDGVDDHLLVTDLGRRRAVTLFAVVRPRANAGEFRGMLAAAAAQQNDYVTGFNVDLGTSASDAWNTLNVEAAGAGGAANLVGQPLPFGQFHLLSVEFQPNVGIRVRIDGHPTGERAWSGAELALDTLFLGARYYRNEPGPAYVRGFFEGDLAEVLLYDRALAEPQRDTVERYLLDKHAAFLRTPAEESSPLQMLRPGFTLRALPLTVTNVNDLAYDLQGHLWLLGYDGRVHWATDSDDDGLEDSLHTFWDQPGLLSPLAMCVRPEGVYVSSRGKISKLVDKNLDGRGDEEVVVASGWEPPDNASGGVDSLGMAFDEQGRLHFALGCADFTNAYRIEEGRARFALDSERGTILRVETDGKRTRLATGVRFAVALAFNRHGDLFATDQEGETWLPGGNPLDELLHIQAGRHYGFPPRHPEHLPQVTDTPAVATYGPQHQSTCGLTFNGARGGAKSFGPAFWEEDALVSGYSRGKLWRTKLTRQPTGYVALTQLIASARMLLVDAVVSPRGDLVVSAHSGQPDWGRGPTGPATLWKVQYTDRQLPQSILAWPVSPVEVRVAFDRPLPEGWLHEAAIEFGEHVRAADRLEYLRPGYESVQRQMAAPRYPLAVRGLSTSEDRRTLILSTDPHTARAHYALTLRMADKRSAPIDMDYELAGVELLRPQVSADSKDAPVESAARRWRPHPDPAISRALVSGAFGTPEESLHGFIASTVIAPWAGPGTLVMQTTGPASVLPRVWINGEIATPRHSSAGWRWEIPIAQPMRLRWEAGDRAPLVNWHWELAPGVVVPLPLAAFRLPWEPPAARPAAVAVPTVADISTGGDWQRGRELFFSAQTQCSQCHRVRGQGAGVGPDLSNLVARDAASVTRDITDPNATIHPDYIPLILHLASGETLTGLARPRGAEALAIVDAQAKEQVVPTAEIVEFAASSVSIMPSDLAKKLPAADLRDLVAFLTEAEPQPPASAAGHTPPLRIQEEVQALHAAVPALDAAPERSINIVLLAGAKDHGPGEHDYPHWLREWQTLLAKAPQVRVATAMDWLDDAHLELADLIVCYFWNHAWTADRYAQLDRFLARGGGLVMLHAATIADTEPERLAERLGIAFQPGRSKYRHGPVTLEKTPVDSPITRGLSSCELVDETYWNLVGDVSRVQVLATAVEEGQSQPILWTFEPGRGRVFGCVLGHYTWTFDDPLFRTLVLRGMAWAVREPESRWQPLAIEGVRWDK